jgi:hypothetical protein
LGTSQFPVHCGDREASLWVAASAATLKGPINGALAPEGADVGRIARRVRQAGVYFVTTDTWQKHPLFINTALANIVVEQIVSCRERGFYKLHAFISDAGSFACSADTGRNNNG